MYILHTVLVGTEGVLPGHQSHRCEDCGRSYKYRDNLQRHKRQECGKEPQFACTLCPYRAKYRSTLRAHMVCKHPDEFINS